MRTAGAAWLGASPTVLLCATAWLPLACSGAVEAERVELPVYVAAASATEVQTNLGYRVELIEAQLVFDDLQFAIAGEAHAASFRDRLANWLIPTAHAHPGHFSGGDITGELLGHFVARWPAADSMLGMATLIVGKYESANFTFARAEQGDGLMPGDPLLGHTGLLRGTATRGDTEVPFVALLDSPAERQLTGAPFEVTVDSDSDSASPTDRRVVLQLQPTDPYESDTLFDDVDFEQLPADESGVVTLRPGLEDLPMLDAYNDLRRRFQTHDHYNVVVTTEE